MPHQYSGCTRGCFGTTAAAISTGTAVKPLGVFENCTRGVAGTSAAAHSASGDIQAFATDDAFRKVVAHELGHAVGMGEWNSEPGIMRQYVTRGAYLGNDIPDYYDDDSQDQINAQ